jgi:hypothetical protein
MPRRHALAISVPDRYKAGMGATRRELEKRITRKQQDIRDLQQKIREAEIYVGALQDVLRLLPKGVPEEASQFVLRSGSSLARVREEILKAGHPLHVVDLLKVMGLPGDRKHRGGLSGTLSPYVRRGQIFTRPAPNTFGLKELEGQSEHVAAESEGEPPESFGTDEGDEPKASRPRVH